MQFDEDLVLKQLRYTGMLETVRIKRSGYGAKYTFKVHKHTCLLSVYSTACMFVLEQKVKRGVGLLGFSKALQIHSNEGEHH